MTNTTTQEATARHARTFCESFRTVEAEFDKGLFGKARFDALARHDARLAAAAATLTATT